MINVGDVITIKISEALKFDRLTTLAGREAEVLEVLTSIQRLNKGYLVKLTGAPYLGDDIWFIPQESIDDEDE